MREIQDVLVNDLGLDLTGWTLTSAEAISANGRTVAGYGINPSGEREAWVASFVSPIIPTISLFAGISFDTRDGSTYSVTASDDVEGPYVEIGTVIGDGTRQIFFDDRVVRAAQFYRIIEE
jgi:hypothetical protein